MLSLQYQPLAALKFPKSEWKWLRQTPEFLSADAHSFVYAIRSGETLWCWTPRGSSLSNNGDVSVPVLILGDAPDEATAFLTYVKIAFQGQSPIEVEWVWALKNLKEIFNRDISSTGIPDLLSATLRNAGLEPHLGVLANRARYTFLNDNELQFLFQKKWDPNTFELIESIDTSVRAAFLSTLQQWPLSSGHAKELLQSTLFLTRKLGAEIALKILNTKYKSADELRMAVFHSAQPELARLSQIRLERLRALAVPPRTSVFGDPSFESDQLKISHNPKSIGDFEAFKNWVADPQTTERLRQLLEIYQ